MTKLETLAALAEYARLATFQAKAAALPEDEKHALLVIAEAAEMQIGEVFAGELQRMGKHG